MADTGQIRVKQEPEDFLSPQQAGCSNDFSTSPPFSRPSEDRQHPDQGADNSVYSSFTGMGGNSYAMQQYERLLSSQRTPDNMADWQTQMFFADKMNMENIDVPQVVDDFKNTLEKFGVSQRFASKYIMRDTSQGNLSFLLEKGKNKNWEELSQRGRAPYIRMKAWLDSKDEQIQTLEMLKHSKALNKPGPKETWYRREKFSPFQLTVLCRLFEENPNPSIGTRTALANKLNIHIERINVWFQNQRARGFPAKRILKHSVESMTPVMLNVQNQNVDDVTAAVMATDARGTPVSEADNAAALSYVSSYMNNDHPVSPKMSNFGSVTPTSLYNRGDYLESNSTPSHLQSLEFLQNSFGNGIQQNRNAQTPEIPHLYSRALQPVYTHTENNVPGLNYQPHPGIVNDDRSQERGLEQQFSRHLPFSQHSGTGYFSRQVQGNALSNQIHVKQEPKDIEQQRAPEQNNSKKFFGDQSIDTETEKSLKRKHSLSEDDAISTDNNTSITSSSFEPNEKRQRQCQKVPFFNFLSFKNKRKTLHTNPRGKTDCIDTEQTNVFQPESGSSEQQRSSNPLSALQELTMFASNLQSSNTVSRRTQMKSLANLRHISQMNALSGANYSSRMNEGNSNSIQNTRSQHTDLPSGLSTSCRKTFDVSSNLSNAAIRTIKSEPQTPDDERSLKSTSGQVMPDSYTQIMLACIKQLNVSPKTVSDAETSDKQLDMIEIDLD